jgi:hypothetical protein
MKKLLCRRSVALLLLAATCMAATAQSFTNTSTALTLNGTCLNSANLPDGAYTLTIHYIDLANGQSTPDLQYSASVTHSGSDLVITASGANFPTLAANGFWQLRDTKGGMIDLTNGANTGRLYWQFSTMICEPFIPVIKDFTGALNNYNNQVNVSWRYDGNPGPASNVTGVTGYRSTDGGQTFYEIGGFNTPFNEFTDKAPGAHNQYYISMQDKWGFCSRSNIISVDCPACNYPQLGEAPCDMVLTGVDYICNLEERQRFWVNSLYSFHNAVTWTISPSNLVNALINPCWYNAETSLIRSGANTGIVTLSAKLTHCSNTFHKRVLIGKPGTLHVSANYSGSSYMDGTATCDDVPGTTDAQYSWTLNLGSKGTTNYTGKGINFSLPPCSGGSLNVTVQTPCGTVTDGITVFNSNCRPFASGFVVSPNPASSSITITAAQQPEAVRGLADGNNMPSVSQVKVYSQLGELLISQNYTGTNRSVSLDVLSLRPGNYVLHIYYGNSGSREVQQLAIRK